MHREVQMNSDSAHKDNSHQPTQPRKKLHFFVVQSSNLFSGADNHYSLEQRTPFKVVSQKIKQNHLINKIKSQQTKLQQYRQNIHYNQTQLQTVYQQIQKLTSEHQELKAQQMALTYWLQQKHKQIANLRQKNNKLKQAFNQQDIRKRQQIDSFSMLNKNLTITTKQSQKVITQPSLSARQCRMSSIINEGSDNPENMSENGLKANQFSSQPFPNSQRDRRLKESNLKKEMKNSSLISEFDGPEQEIIMTRSADRRKNVCESRKAQPQTVIKQTEEETKEINEQKGRAKSLQVKIKHTQTVNEQGALSEDRKAEKDPRAMIITTVLIVLIIVLALIQSLGIDPL